MTWETAQKEGMTYGEWQYQQSKASATSPISTAVNKPYVAPTPKTISQAVNSPYVAPAIKPANTAPSASTPLIPGMAGTTLTPTAPKPAATTPTAEQIAAMNAVPGSTAEMERQIEAQGMIQQSSVTGIGNGKSAEELALESAVVGTGGGTGGGTSGTTPVAPVATPQPTAPTGEGSSADLINKAIADVNAQMETIANTVFDYNPLADQSYLRDAANLENQIVQMMAGRGGMYSSVTQNAIASQMMSLQVDYLEQKRAQFIEDRNFKLSLAQQNFENAMSVASAKNTQEQQALEQAWRELEFKVKQEQIAYERQQQAQANALALAKFNFEKEMQLAEMNAANSIAGVESAYAVYQDVYTEFYKQKARWEKLTMADSAIVDAYANLGVQLDMNALLGFSFEANSDAIAELANLETKLKNYAVESGNTADILLKLRELNASSSTIGKTETDVTKTWNATTQEWEYSYKYKKNMNP